MLVGQVRKYFGEDIARLNVGFVPQEHAKKLVHLGTPQVPYCWPGLPRTEA
jgi:hypothetical protein